jgi:hypothetical protein
MNMNEDLNVENKGMYSGITEGKGCATWIVVFAIAVFGVIILFA